MKRAQASLEFIIVTCVVIAALIAMTGYLKRGIQGHQRVNADSGFGEQYDPENMTSDFTIQTTGTEVFTTDTADETVPDGTVKLKTTVTSQDLGTTTTKNGWEEVGAF